MANDFEVKVKSILSNLDSKIKDLQANGENSNGQIETRGEKNKLAELLAGAEKELEEAAEINEKQIENLPHKTYKKVSSENSSIYSQAKNYIINLYKNIFYSLKSFETMKDIDGNIKIVDKDDVKQKYPDKTYNRMVKQYDKGSYLAEHMDENGNSTNRFRVYKNDKEYYTNKDYVANKMGLRPSTENIIDIVFGTKPNETDIYEKEDGNKKYIYSWDKKTSQFTLQSVEHIHVPTLYDSIKLSGTIDLNKDYTQISQQMNQEEGLDKYNVRTESEVELEVYSIIKDIEKDNN